MLHGGVGTPEQLQRDRERDDWPEQRGQRREETAAAQWWQGAHVVVSPEVAKREGGDNDDGSETMAAQRWQWQHGRRWQWQHGRRWQWQHRSSRGVAEICREKWRQRARGRRVHVLSPNSAIWP